MLIELAIAFAGWVGGENYVTEYVGAPVSVAAPSACHQRAVDKTVRALPRKAPARVAWANLEAREAWGLAFTSARTIVLSTQMPCAYVSSVLNHEWTHQATSDEFGGQTEADQAIGRENVELVADCAGETLTRKLGAKRYTPYTSGQAKGYEAHHGCPRAMRTLANKLIG